MLSNKIYDVLKWCCILFLPALATLYKGLGGIWNWAFIEEIPQSIIVIDAFLGALLGISTIDYKAKEAELAEARRLNGQDE